MDIEFCWVVRLYQLVHVSERNEIICVKKYGAIVSSESNCGTKTTNILILFLKSLQNTY